MSQDNTQAPALDAAKIAREALAADFTRIWARIPEKLSSDESLKLADLSCGLPYVEIGVRAALDAVAGAVAVKPAAREDVPPLRFTYRNYRGEVGERTVTPLGVRFGSTEWHPEPQWLLRAFDHDKQAEREFAMADMGSGARLLPKVKSAPLVIEDEERDDWANRFPLTLTPTPSAPPAEPGLVERLRAGTSGAPDADELDQAAGTMLEAADVIEALTDRVEAAEAGYHRRGVKIIGMTETVGAEMCRREKAEAKLAAREAEVARLRRACQWYSPEDDTSGEACCDSPEEVVENAYGWGTPTGEVVSVARGGVIEVSYCAALPPAPDADSDDEFWVGEPTEEAARAKIAAERERRAALTPVTRDATGKEGG